MDSIVRRLQEKRNIELARSVLESAGYSVEEDPKEVALPQELVAQLEVGNVTKEDLIDFVRNLDFIPNDIEIECTRKFDLRFYGMSKEDFKSASASTYEALDKYAADLIDRYGYPDLDDFYAKKFGED